MPFFRAVQLHDEDVVIVDVRKETLTLSRRHVHVRADLVVQLLLKRPAQVGNRRRSSVEPVDDE